MSNVSSITQRIPIVISLSMIFGGVNCVNAEQPDITKRRYCCANYGEDMVSAGYLKGKTACLGKLAKPLIEADGFSGALNCEDSHLKVIKVGDILVKGRKFSIFDYHYTSIPKPGLVAHGGQRLIIIKDDKTYVGQYSNFDCECKMRIQGTSVYLKGVPKSLGNRISFGIGSPPEKVYLNGNVTELGN